MSRKEKHKKMTEKATEVKEEVVKKQAAPETEELNQVVSITMQELNDLKAKAKKSDEHWERVLRDTAEFENIKKRLEKRSQELVKFGNERLVLEILQITDDLDRALVSFDADTDRTHIKKGLEIISNKFHKILDENGVQPIKTEHQSFDPNLHEAVGEVETNEVEEGHITEELQRGYLLNGRLARPSRVRVAKSKKS